MANGEDTIRLVVDMGASAQNIQVVTAQLDAIEHSSRRVAAGSGDMSRGIMQASYAVQDFTSVLGTQGLGRAMAAVQNNIPGLLTSLGTGAGLAGVVSLVSIGVGLLYDNWDKIATLWGQGQTAEEAERMKELAKETKQAADAAEKLMKTLPPEQRAGAKGIGRAVEAFGGPAVLEELRKEILQTGAWGDAAKDMAKVLFQNLMAGRRDALRFLEERRPMGPVGAVLRGEPTPEEEEKESLRRGREANRIADQAAEEAKKGREKEARDEDRAAQHARAEGERRRKEGERERDHARAENRRLAHHLGEEARVADRAGVPVPHLGRAREIGAEEVPAVPQMAEVVQNQREMGETMCAIAQLNREIMAARRRNRTTIEFVQQPARGDGHP